MNSKTTAGGKPTTPPKDYTSLVNSSTPTVGGPMGPGATAHDKKPGSGKRRHPDAYVLDVPCNKPTGNYPFARREAVQTANTCNLTIRFRSVGHLPLSTLVRFASPLPEVAYGLQ